MRQQSRTGTHGDHQVVFDFQLMTQGQDEALAVLLALTDQEHAAAQTRVTAVTGRQFTTWTTDTIVDMSGKKPWRY